MKNLIDFVTNSDSNLFLASFVLLVVIILLYSFSKKIRSLLREKKIQNNPLSFGAEHINCYFKILKINGKKGIVYLGYNPTVQHPFGVGGAWFDIHKIPEKLREEYSVIFLEERHNINFFFSKGPIF